MMKEKLIGDLHKITSGAVAKLKRKKIWRIILIILLLCFYLLAKKKEKRILLLRQLLVCDS